MKEVKLYGSLLAVSLIVAFWSYTKGEKTPASGSEKVDVVEVPKDSLRGLVYFAKTSTVEVSFKKDEAGKEYPWFAVEQGKRKRSFAGNDKVKAMLDGFAPFKALRTLGKLEGAELKETKLEAPEKKLVLKLRDGERAIDVGGRTSGSRDHYVRPAGGKDVYLVASAVLGDLEFPEGRFMQRKLREEAVKDISKAVLSANGKTKTIYQKNRLSPSDAFWALESAPEEKNETVDNYVDKLEKLAATDFANDDEKYPREGTPILEVRWFGEDETKEINQTEIWKVEGADKKVEYYAISNATHVPVKLSKFAAEQVERDLGTVLAAGTP
jgi:hypothetical protein